MSSVIFDVCIFTSVWLNIYQLVDVGHIYGDGAVLVSLLLRDLSEGDVESIQYKVFNLHQPQFDLGLKVWLTLFSKFSSVLISSAGRSPSTFSPPMSLSSIEGCEGSEAGLGESSSLFSLEFLFLSLFFNSFFFLLPFPAKGSSFIPEWELFLVLLEINSLRRAINWRILILDHYLRTAHKCVELFVHVGTCIERGHSLPQWLLILIKVKVIFVSKCCLRSPWGYKLFPRLVSINFTPKTFDWNIGNSTSLNVYNLSLVTDLSSSSLQ